MRFSFKKIGSVLASTAMLTSTVALAAAANFPAPFVQNSAASVAIVHGGANAAYTDLVAVTDISSYLSSELARQTAKGGSTLTGTTSSVQGEAAPLFTGTRFYLNDTLNAVKNVITKTDMKTVLSDGSFSGNVDATFTQTITMGFNPQLTYANKQPTSSDDNSFGILTSTTAANYIYNVTINFNKAVNFTHADSKGQDMTILGQKYTVASATSDADLVLLKTAERISLTSDDPSAEVTIKEKAYTVELVSASDTAATVKVTDSEGKSETREVSENASKKINGITIAITNADETNLKLSANVIAGAEKVTFPVSATTGIVTKGEDATSIDGTAVNISGGSTAATKITLSVFAPNSDNDFIRPGKEFVDPVFGTFKINFNSLSVPDDTDATTTDREKITVANTADDKLAVTFTDSRDKTATVQFARNISTGVFLMPDDEARNMSVLETRRLFKNDFVVTGNEESGRLLKVTEISNGTTGITNDKIKFQDVFSGDTYEGTITTEGTGSLSVAGKQIDVTYNGTSTSDDSVKTVRLNYGDSSGAGVAIAYPTIKTSKGAFIAFYKPLNLTLHNWDDDYDASLTKLSMIRIPDGDGYTDVTITDNTGFGPGIWNITFGTTTTMLNTTSGPGVVSNGSQGSIGGSIGKLTFNLTAEGVGAAGTEGVQNRTILYLLDPENSAKISNPALIIFEEKDDNSDYQAMIVTVEPGSTSDDGIGLDDVIRTWHADGRWDRLSLAGDSKKTKESDLWGSIILEDSGDSDQKKGVISYPDNQVYANLYVAKNDAEITSKGGGGGVSGVTELGSVSVTDAEVSSVTDKNLIVVGGSCVNTVAAQLLGVSAKTCGADFTAKTGVDANQFLIETFSRTGGKVATLVAGYNALDTTNAAKYLTTNKMVDTTAGKKYKGTSATVAELVTEPVANATA